MMSPGTEQLHDLAAGLEQRALVDVAAILGAAQAEAAAVPSGAAPVVALAARSMADALRGSGRLIYLGAGSSALMAAADAMELGGTFGVPVARVRILMAGGLPTSAEMPGGTEDDVAGLEAGLADVSAADVVIAVSASGTTPYTLAGVKIAQARGAIVIGIANNPGSALLEVADHAVLLQTPPEVISGSTRMGAGTAQKIALNMLSTLMAVDLGHTHDGMMVNLIADNAKLRARACGIVGQISGASPEQAEQALAQAQGAVKLAVLLARGASSAEEARDILNNNKGHLGAALAHLAET